MSDRDTPPLPAPPESPIERLERKVDALAVNVDVLVEDAKQRNARVTKLEERADAHSDRAKELVRTTSQADLEQDAKIAAEIVAREQLAKDVVELKSWHARIGGAIAHAASHPVTAKLAIAIAAAFSGWLASKGFK